MGHDVELPNCGQAAWVVAHSQSSAAEAPAAPASAKVLWAWVFTLMRSWVNLGQIRKNPQSQQAGNHTFRVKVSAQFKDMK